MNEDREQGRGNREEGRGNREQVTCGCPSLGLPRLPSGFDGVELCDARTGYEQLAGNALDIMLEAKIHAPVEREAREMFFKQIVGDVAAALACVCPIDYGVRDRRPAPADETNDVDEGEQKRLESFKARKICWQEFSTPVDLTVMGRTNQNSKVFEIRIMKRNDPKHTNDFFCNVNGFTVMEGDFTGSAWMLRKMLKRAMQAMVDEKARRRAQQRRWEKRRDSKSHGLMPSTELSATVARQMDDDELAQQIENA